ncbi:MAG: polysaccharide deacetylase family protein [Candidatus Omnitrophota bacterium]|jgi:peptidoglycan/xylan/chitin deacetylase (PgdA/CDA1 family)
MKKIIKITIWSLVLSFLGFYLYLYAHYTTPILMYHSFDKARTKDYAAVSLEKFRHQAEFIKNGKYTAISLPDYCKLLRDKKPIPRNLVVITIDDGYNDNLPAFEILKQFDFPSTVFLVTKDIGKPGFLSSKNIISSIADNKINIGSHTNTHPDLSKITKEKIKEELTGSKNRLEKILNTQVEVFAYPGGAFNKQALAGVEESGYVCACTTNRGFSRSLNRFALRRIKITDKDNDFTLWAKLSGYYNIFKKVKKPY